MRRGYFVHEAEVKNMGRETVDVMYYVVKWVEIQIDRIIGRKRKSEKERERR
jgi:hypothetical protein